MAAKAPISSETMERALEKLRTSTVSERELAQRALERMKNTDLKAKDMEIDEEVVLRYLAVKKIRGNTCRVNYTTLYARGVLLERVEAALLHHQEGACPKLAQPIG